MKFVHELIDFAEDQPRLLRSAIYGGALLFGMTVFRILVLAPGRGPRALLPALGALVLATVGGAIGGVFYGLLQPLARFGAIGRWLRWTLGIAVYIGAILAIMAPFDAEARSMLQDSTARVIGLVVLVLYGTAAAWMWRDMPELPHEPRIPAEIWLRDAVTADLQELRERGNPDPELVRIDLVERQEPSRAYVMHLWRVVGRLGRIPAPSRQARIALRRAQRMLARAQRDLERSRSQADSTVARGA
jgi:hypothetical protein